MAQDLVVFPLTDFRFARPEVYPSLLPVNILTPHKLETLRRLANYAIFAMPFGLFLVGLVAIGLAVRQRKWDLVSFGITAAVGYLVHRHAAHVQINTHIITMSIYGASLGALAWHVFPRPASKWRSISVWLLGCALGVGWVLALAAEPIYLAWFHRSQPATQLAAERVAGISLGAAEAGHLDELIAFVDARLGPQEAVFTGLHRHDVIVISDMRLNFLLNRPYASRYHELHPAIADTAPVQQEIIADLQRRDVKMVVLKNIFPNETLEAVKADFLRNLPNIGATDLDEFLRANYAEVRRIGPYAVWQRQHPTRSDAPIWSE
jgi:hypothetical protein